VLPEVGHGEHAPRAREGAGQRGGIVEVAGRDLGACLGERRGGRRVGLAGNCAQRELAGRVGEDRSRQPAALGAGGADDCNDGFR
jgi:hypothetical protein